MLTRRNQIIVIITIAIFGACVWGAVSSWITTPHRVLSDRIAQVQQSVDRRRADLDLDHRVQAELNAYASRTFGGSRETVDHALRDVLSELAISCGLEPGLSVDTDAPRVVQSPGRRDFKGSASRALRDEPDFVEMPATVRARGTWRQISDLLVGLSTQPWLNQTESISLVGKGNMDDVAAVIKVRSLYIPDRDPSGPMPLPEVDTAGRLAVKSPFLLPASEPTIRPGSKPSPPPPPGWERWRATFVGRIEGKDEVLLQAGRGGVTRLHPGDVLEDCEYLGNRRDADGFDLAVFRRHGEVWAVPPGVTFRDRQPISE